MSLHMSIAGIFARLARVTPRVRLPKLARSKPASSSRYAGRPPAGDPVRMMALIENATRRQESVEPRPRLIDPQPTR